MADLDAIYNAYNEIKDANENAPQVTRKRLSWLQCLSKLVVNLVLFPPLLTTTIARRGLSHDFGIIPGD